MAPRLRFAEISAAVCFLNPFFYFYFEDTEDLKDFSFTFQEVPCEKIQKEGEVLINMSSAHPELPSCV